MVRNWICELLFTQNSSYFSLPSRNDTDSRWFKCISPSENNTVSNKTGQVSCVVSGWEFRKRVAVIKLVCENTELKFSCRVSEELKQSNTAEVRTADPSVEFHSCKLANARCRGKAHQTNSNAQKYICFKVNFFTISSWEVEVNHLRLSHVETWK